MISVLHNVGVIITAVLTVPICGLGMHIILY